MTITQERRAMEASVGTEPGLSPVIVREIAALERLDETADRVQKRGIAVAPRSLSPRPYDAD